MPALSPEDDPELTGEERVAVVVWHLAHGEGLTTLQIARMTGLKWHAAYRLMTRISRKIPIYLEDRCGGDRRWQVCAMRELH